MGGVPVQQHTGTYQLLIRYFQVLLDIGAKKPCKSLHLQRHVSTDTPLCSDVLLGKMQVIVTVVYQDDMTVAATTTDMNTTDMNCDMAVPFILYLVRFCSPKPCKHDGHEHGEKLRSD